MHTVNQTVSKPSSSYGLLQSTVNNNNNNKKVFIQGQDIKLHITIHTLTIQIQYTTPKKSKAKQKLLSFFMTIDMLKENKKNYNYVIMCNDVKY